MKAENGENIKAENGEDMEASHWQGVPSDASAMNRNGTKV